MEWIIETLRANPSLAVFLTIGLGFWVGSLKYKAFSLGTVTSVLLVGVLVGQLDIPISGPMKNAFFLLFLFSIGYSVGPQFFQALRGDGIKQVFFAVVVCVLCLVVTWGLALMMGYNVGEAVGLLAGAQTMSACIGVGTDTINSLSASAQDKQSWIDMIPVCYAVCYVFGTIGSAYLLANLGPAMLGGIKKVREQTRLLEEQMNTGSASSDPNYINAQRPVVFRAYKAEADYFAKSVKVSDFEQYMAGQQRRLFVERIRSNGTIVEPQPDTVINRGDEVVLSGRREYIIGDEQWIGTEVVDAELLDFKVEQIAVHVTKKGAARKTVDQLRQMPQMYGVSIRSIVRSGTQMPVMAQFKLQPGDIVTIVGLSKEVDTAAPVIGQAEQKSDKSNLIIVGLGIFFGGLIGALTLHLGNVPVSLSTSGGALIMGLILGWFRSRHPSIGGIPSQSVWLMDNLGLNMFIAVVGITSGPSFVGGLQKVGFTLFFIGALATAIPLILSIIIGAKIFKFPPAINLGCCAGARTTTASLGAIQDSLGSSLPAMGYTVTYAIGNTLLILWGVVLVLMMS